MTLSNVSKESQSYMTEDGMFTPRRLQQGSYPDVQDIVEKPAAPRNKTKLCTWIISSSASTTKTNHIGTKDDFSHFCELIECSDSDAATAAKVILDWNSRYGKPKLLISDTAAHFKNQLCHTTQMTKSFALAYHQWINGNVEPPNRDEL
ncbi:unnamed protein product [Phytophthora fragariaefolia]|uniref:Unnamed protein product n=1 Tax=Phytophthora fragariaefolia TaxID=1490495 RepID=A0A9W6YCX7_9STRA|nr:unnamed protein product [Phytophthora fragariaefolia]